MKKSFILTTLLTMSASTIPNIILINNTNAVSAFDINSNKLTKNIKENEDKSILDFDQLMKDAAVAAFKTLIYPGCYNPYVTDLSYSNFNISDIEITPNGDPIVTPDKTAIFMGENILTNNTDETIPLSTSAFEKKVTNTITSSVTEGISLAARANFNFFNNDFKFDYNTTETTTKKTTIDVIAPSQTFQIPPHSKYKASVYLGQNNSKINLNLNAKISGKINCTIHYDAGWTRSFSIEIPTALEMLSEQKGLPKGISVDDKNNQIIFKGAAIAQNAEENDSFSVITEKLPN